MKEFRYVPSHKPAKQERTNNGQWRFASPTKPVQHFELMENVENNPEK